MALNGNDNDNRFRGTSFDDEINGFGGNDVIGGSPGDDTIDGGDDIDLVDYHFFWVPIPLVTGVIPHPGDAVDVDLERAVQFGGYAEGDVLFNVENIGGSGESDVIRGNSIRNQLFGGSGNDFIEGRGGDDEIFGDTDGDGFALDADDDQLDGGEGEDTIFGEGGNDTLIGGLNDDVLFGGSGNDTFLGDQGNDELDGGSGSDTVSYANSVAAVIVSLDLEIGIGGDAANDDLVDIENVVGTAFADQLFGSAVANELDGGNGADLLAGFAGADTLDGGFGTDTAIYAASGSGVVVDLDAGTGTGGDAGNDELSSIENLVGSSFLDALYGNSFGNVLDGGAGTDVLVGRGGNDTYIVDNAGDFVSEAASQGTDEVRAAVSFALAGSADIETLRTTNDNGTGAINLTGSNTNNQIIGNNGANTLNGGAGVDQLIGRGGNDLYFVDNAADAITENGGQGIDEVRTSVSYVLTAGADVETLATVNDNATTAIDLSGNGSGNNVRGNNGTNAINGGAGNDALTGRGGADAFVFDTALNAATNVDEITDFNVADDTIQLQNAVFTGLVGGTLGANQFVIGAAAQDADDRIVYDNTTGALFFDVDGTGGTAAIQFAEVTAGLALTNLDFLVF